MLGKIEGRRKRGQQRMRWSDGITDSMDMGLGEALFHCANSSGVPRGPSQLHSIPDFP